MIKRTYFISTKCTSNKSNGGYSHFSTTASITTWFPVPDFIFKEMAGYAEKEFANKGLPVTKMQVISFNRVN